MPPVRTQVPVLAALVELWRQWVHACLLPMVSWDHQGARPRCRRRTAKMQEALEEVRAAFDRHALSQRLAPQVLVDGQAGATDHVNTLPRASSAVEGCNGSLSHMHHHSNTTVVLTEPNVVCRANIWRSLGASGATRTRLEYAPRAAVWPARDARRGGASRRTLSGTPTLARS